MIARDPHEVRKQGGKWEASTERDLVAFGFWGEGVAAVVPEREEKTSKARLCTRRMYGIYAEIGVFRGQGRGLRRGDEVC